MKIGMFFGEPIEVGGQEAFVEKIVEQFDREDINVDFITPYYENNRKFEQLARKKGGNIYEFGLTFSPGTLRGNLLLPLIKHLRRHKYDVVHVHSGSISVLGIVATVACLSKTKKVLVHSHCSGVPGLKHTITKLIFSPLFYILPLTFCACSYEAALWKFPDGIAKKKTLIIKNGINLDEFNYSKKIRNEIRNKLNSVEETVLIGCIGRLAYQKNQEFLLDILACLERKGNKGKYKLVLIGEGEDREYLASKAEKLGVSDRILFTGNISNVGDYLMALDIVVMPSRFEGFPFVAVEAQAMGVPVIASTNISEEIKITHLVEFADLKNKNEWTGLIEDKAKCFDRDAKFKLLEKGYEIRDVANLLLNEYCCEIN